MPRPQVIVSSLIWAALWAAISCRRPDHAVVTLAAASPFRSAYREIIPLFERSWRRRTGREVRVRASFRDGSLQARAIAGGFPADVAAPALSADLDRLVKAGLITRPWRKAPNRGVAARSVVALAVREGNPKRVQDWGDLARAGVAVTAPHPKASGAARWTFIALYGAAERGTALPYAGGADGAARFAAAVMGNTAALDAGARASLRRFAGGRADAAVALESELMAARAEGLAFERVTPRSTVLAESPVAVVDVVAGRHGVDAEARAFVGFLWTPEAQDAFARNGFRPVDVNTLSRFRDRFPTVPDLWTVEDVYGGWAEAGTIFFGPGGVFDAVMEDVHAR